MVESGNADYIRVLGRKNFECSILVQIQGSMPRRGHRNRWRCFREHDTINFHGPARTATPLPPGQRPDTSSSFGLKQPKYSAQCYRAAVGSIGGR
ncbi:hypothetical protein JMJ77_0011308 [Colletotrichum scovillei]|uniref:Uncharacterized protein n=1 Tax=Colletotrichum scovillei TaxID=1209932 RepID=A0A9P7R1X5_9PEZI|nr:hypothetical protein JMJ77_0011308 [Colletotrichum scovillei]KAG7060307.1 hypothetical protein JMJ78_0015582 [Colletotrichum scovillei]KAG7067737.1 hypothetical protein JMJ76_0009165 [Colletotrichum scovillei]